MQIFLLMHLHVVQHAVDLFAYTSDVGFKRVLQSFRIVRKLVFIFDTLEEAEIEGQFVCSESVELS